MKLIAVDGNHGSGKSHHVRALAANLRKHGVRASAWQHRAPAVTDPYGAALDFAAQRHLYVTNPLYAANEVRVTDRWVLSTAAVARTLPGDTHLPLALDALVDAERYALPRPWLTLVLDAPDAELDARIRARGAEVSDVDRACREVYRNAAVLRMWGAVWVNTDRPVEGVEADVLTLALRALEVG